jgi:hypothetical protein
MRPLATALVAALVLPATAAAAGAPVFAIKPVGHADLGYYRFAAVPGQDIAGRVRVVNVGDAAGTVELAAVDATTGATTGAVYATVGDHAEDVGGWIALHRREVRLAPGASAVVGFSVTVPDPARPGEHLGGLVARPVAGPASGAQGEADRSFSVDVIDQSILAVQVDLPGTARALLEARGIEAGGNPGYQTLRIALSNPGEKMIKGSGTVIVTRPGGEEVARQDFAIDTFLPRTGIDYPLVVRGDALLPADYRAEVRLRWDGDSHSSVALPFSVSRKNIEQAYGSEGVAKLPDGASGEGASPAPLIGGALLLVLALLGGMALWMRRRTRELEARLLAAAVAVPDPGGEVRVTDAREQPLIKG